MRLFTGPVCRLDRRDRTKRCLAFLSEPVELLAVVDQSDLPPAREQLIVEFYSR